MHEERSHDIPKLLEFFRRCKYVNKYFYWDAQIDRKTCTIKNIYFGIMLVSVPSVGILAMSLHLTRRTRQTNIGCH
jgi:hypothetical protein